MRACRFIVAIGLFLAGCSLPGGTTIARTPVPISAEGRLHADSVDCIWIKTVSGERIDLLLPPPYSVREGPIRIIASDGSVLASEGDTVRVFGRRPDVAATSCASGTPFPVENVIRISSGTMPP